MAEYIERESLIEVLRKSHSYHARTSRDYSLLGRDIRLVKEQPAADVVEVVHGRWETDKEDIEWGNSLKKKHCTNCGKRPHFDKEKRQFILTDYCPHCGAKNGQKG